MEYTNTVDEVNLDERLKKLHRNVKSLQQNEEVSVKYMQLWEEMEYERREARDQFAALVKILLAEGLLDELEKATEDAEYREELLAQYNL